MKETHTEFVRLQGAKRINVERINGDGKKEKKAIKIHF